MTAHRAHENAVWRASNPASMHWASPRCTAATGTGPAHSGVQRRSTLTGEAFDMRVRTVLLADDDPAIRRIAEIALEREGFQVSTVGDGSEALQYLEDSLFDLVILDGLMPKMDGLEACRRMKESPRTARIPVIILSARSQDVDEDAGRAAGAAGYIRKPFDATRLGRHVRLICWSVTT